MKAQGQCLCGSVTLAVDFNSGEVAACHCSMCRTWGGGPMLAIDCADTVSIDGQKCVEKYASSEWAERGFCNKCGTHLFYYLLPASQYHIPVGLLGVEEEFKLTHQIFIDEKPSYYEFKNETRNMTGEEVFAYFDDQN